MVRFQERLTAPARWWVVAVLLALSAGVAVGFYLGPALGLTVGAVAMAIGTAVLVSAAVVITVDDRVLCVGRARIEFDYLGPVRALDATETAHRTGPGADARAYLVLRPYVPTAVEVAVEDAADPVPYWLISTRHPRRLAAALEAASEVAR